MTSSGWVGAEAVAHVLLVVTFFLILLTVLINGGAAAAVMKRLRLRAEDDIGCPRPPNRPPPPPPRRLLSRKHTPAGILGGRKTLDPHVNADQGPCHLLDALQPSSQQQRTPCNSLAVLSLPLYLFPCVNSPKCQLGSRMLRLRVNLLRAALISVNDVLLSRRVF